MNTMDMFAPSTQDEYMSIKTENIDKHPYLHTDNPNYQLYERVCGDALKHIDRPIWIVDYPPIQGYRSRVIFHAYKAIEPVKKGAMFWTANNIRITPKDGVDSLAEAMRLVEAA